MQGGATTRQLFAWKGTHLLQSLFARFIAIIPIFLGSKYSSVRRKIKNGNFFIGIRFYGFEELKIWSFSLSSFFLEYIFIKIVMIDMKTRKTNSNSWKSIACRGFSLRILFEIAANTLHEPTALKFKLKTLFFPLRQSWRNVKVKFVI